MGSDNSLKNSKKVIKNTILLYFRSFLSMFIGIYSSRVILSSLGVIDYGIYSLIGGVVLALSFIQGALYQASQRFITVELGKESDNKKVNEVFCMTMNVHIILVLIIVITAEIAGIYLLNNQLKIPDDRLSIAFWVMQFSIATVAFNMISSPYTGIIIAHEDLGSFAYFDLLTSILKLLAAYAITFFSIDRLLLYAIFIFFSSFFIRQLYAFFCLKKYKEKASYHFLWRRDLFKSMISFSVWTTLSAFTSTFRRQGYNIIYNIFYGILINPAFGIANQVSNAVMGFVGNFGTAFMPRITKNYTAGYLESTYKFIRINAKVSYFIVLIFAIPLIVECDYILNLWLGNVPPHTATVLSIILIQGMMMILSYGVHVGVRARGKVKNYELILNFATIVGFLIFYISFYLGGAYYIPLLITVIIQFLTSTISVFLGHKLIGFSFSTYIKQVYLKMFLLTLLGFLIPLMISILLEESTFRFILIGFVSISSLPVLFYYIGLDTAEKDISIQIIQSIKNKYSHKKNRMNV